MSKSKPVFTFFLSLLILLFANLISPHPSFSQTETEETLTITTYYPAPYGVYNEMRSKRMAVGDNYINGSTFSWDAGTIDANADLVVEGNVGIGTTAPSAGGEQPLKLDVDGAVGAMYYCDEDGNNCASAPLGGGGLVFGGMYKEDYSNGECPIPNPLTGSCSCPSNFTSVNTGYVYTGGGQHNFWLYYCYRL